MGERERLSICLVVIVSETNTWLETVNSKPEQIKNLGASEKRRRKGPIFRLTNINRREVWLVAVDNGQM